MQIEHPDLCACFDIELLFILHVANFIEIMKKTGVNFAQTESGPMQTQQNLCQPFLFIQLFISCLDLLALFYSLSHKTVNAGENFWNVYCFATNQMRDETAKDNRQTAAGISHDLINLQFSLWISLKKLVT